MSDGKFAAGEKYTVYLEVVPKAGKDAFLFPEKESELREVKVNGKKAVIHSMTPECLVVRYDFGQTQDIVNTVNLTISQPIAGREIPMTASVPGGASMEVSKVRWDGDQSEGKFLETSAYTAYIDVKIKDGVEKVFENDQKILKVTVNGEKAAVYDWKKDVLTIRYNFRPAPASGEPLKKPVKSGSGTIDWEELKGYTPYGNLTGVLAKPIEYHGGMLTFATAPESFQWKDRPDTLPLVGYGDIHIGDNGKNDMVPVYFSPSKTGSARSHLLNELYSMGISNKTDQKPNSSREQEFDSNVVCWPYVGSRVQIVAYDDNWVAVWLQGGWNNNTTGLGFPCHSVDSFGAYWHPGVYYIERQYVYITDAKNHIDLLNPAKQTGTATAKLAVKTEPKAVGEDYIQAGIIKINDTFQIFDTKPENGMYKVWFERGAYYVNAEYVNLKRGDVKKPVIQYKATADQQESNFIGVRIKPDMNEPTIGKLKTGAVVEVIQKDYDARWTQVWYNSRECYVLKAALKNFKALPQAKNLGKALGMIRVDRASKALGAVTYTKLTLNKGKAGVTGGTKLTIPQDKWAPVYEIRENRVTYKYASGKVSYYGNETWYKIYYQGAYRWVKGLVKEFPGAGRKDECGDSFTYYPADKMPATNTVSEKWSVKVDCYYDYDNLAVYTIGSSRYVDIEDIAEMLNLSIRRFGVAYDKKNNRINLTSMQKFAQADKKVTKGTGKKVTAAYDMNTVILDGIPVGKADSYKIGGKYCVNLDAILEAVDCRTEIDVKNKKMKLSPMLPYLEDPGEAKG